MSYLLDVLSNIQQYMAKLERKIFVNDYVYGHLLHNKFSIIDSRHNEDNINVIPEILQLYDYKHEYNNECLYEILFRFTDSVFKYYSLLMETIIKVTHKSTRKSLHELITERDDINILPPCIQYVHIINEFIHYIYNHKAMIIEQWLMTKDGKHNYFSMVGELIYDIFVDYISLIKIKKGKFKVSELLNAVMNTPICMLYKMSTSLDTC